MGGSACPEIQKAQYPLIAGCTLTGHVPLFLGHKLPTVLGVLPINLGVMAANLAKGGKGVAQRWSLSLALHFPDISPCGIYAEELKSSPSRPSQSCSGTLLIP